jgi:uncharacterized membrane protein YoaK (UPF0700 family)
LGVLAFAAGSIDVLSWLALGKVFSAFMTGNVVFLAAGLFAHQSELSLHAAIALCAFGAGAWVTAWVMPREQPSVLWPARVTAGLIACALVQLAFWALWLTVGGHPGSTLMILLGISAFAMGIQTAAAVTLGVHAVFTTAVTATWTVLVGDAAHWSATATERRRLTLVLAGTLLGALVGALLVTSDHRRSRGRTPNRRAIRRPNPEHRLGGAASAGPRVRSFTRRASADAPWTLSRTRRLFARWPRSRSRTFAASSRARRSVSSVRGRKRWLRRYWYFSSPIPASGWG